VHNETSHERSPVHAAPAYPGGGFCPASLGQVLGRHQPTFTWQYPNALSRRCGDRPAALERGADRHRRDRADAARWPSTMHSRWRATEVAIAAEVLNPMLEFGRPVYVRIA